MWRLFSLLPQWLTFYFDFVARWSQLRISMVPTLIVLEPLGESVLIGCVASLATNCLFDVSPLAFFLLHLLAWFLFDYILFRVVEVSYRPSHFVVVWSCAFSFVLFFWVPCSYVYVDIYIYMYISVNTHQFCYSFEYLGARQVYNIYPMCVMGWASYCCVLHRV